MDSQFVAVCVAAAESYLQYLKRNNGGLVSINVLRLRALYEDKLTWEFHLSGRISDLDSIQIEHEPTATKLGSDAFSVKAYDADNKLLILKFLNTPSFLEDHPSPSAIRILTDLRYLVANVRDWYAMHGLNLRLPKTPPLNTSSFDATLLDRPSDEQKIAIETALSSSLSYVWGPPGTGKTRLALTHCVLAIVSRGSRVGVFAPTNIALEQAMDAMLDGAARLGIDKTHFIRLGNPSSAFANKYPEVCESYGLENRIEELKLQIKNIDITLSLRNHGEALRSAESMLDVLNHLQETVDSIRQQSQQMEACRKTSIRIKSKRRQISTTILTIVLGKDSSADKELRQIHDQETQIKTYRIYPRWIRTWSLLVWSDG